MENSISDLSSMPNEARAATKFVLSCILDKIQPLILRIHTKLQLFCDNEDSVAKVRDVYTICTRQICKCLVNLFEIFKLEIHHQTVLQESRQYSLERLSWCLNRLVAVDNNLERLSSSDQDESGDDSINITTMYFVNWIDHTFEVLCKLGELIYKTDYQETAVIYDGWKDNMVECVTELHISIDELLLSAVTLCRYCLPGDQPVVKARCQVVLRETKALLSEVIEGDLSTAIKATREALKLPIMPSNINILIDVLKDVLYALETNTNTALLALLVHCFSFSKPPVNVLKDHFNDVTKGTCACLAKSADDNVTEDCSFVKEFDMYNERLLQIGNFAVSCSSDQNRILTVRSGLASLEALDPHLVPALMMSPDSHHTELLINSWHHEVLDIRDTVFLIVDPAAFAEKSKHMMHQILLSIIKGSCYNNADVCGVINIGCILHELFKVYDKNEPEALACHDKLIPLLADLDKVQTECKIVSNLLSSNEDFVYNVKMPKTNKDVSMDQLVKRLKLLYTVVTRINSLLHPKENDDQLFYEEEELQMSCKNNTRTCRNSDTYVNSPRKPNNVSRSLFARTTVRSSTRNIPLALLTKHIKSKMSTELSFSTQLDNLFNDKDSTTKYVAAKNLDIVKESSALYNFSPIKNRSTLRKAVLNRHKTPNKDVVRMNLTYDKESIMDETTSLQITDILNQMNDMTINMLTVTTSQPKFAITSDNNKEHKGLPTNVLTLNINNQNTTITKNIWNIPVNASSVEMTLDEASNLSLQSNVTTLERISDLDFVESKLNSLKSQLETSL